MQSTHTSVRVKRESCLQSERILSLDSFATSQNFNFQNGSASYRTASGACLNVCILLITLIFTIQQCILLFGYDKTSFTTSVVTDFFDESHSYTQKDQEFMIAFAIVDLDTGDSRDPTGRPMDSILQVEMTQQRLEIFEDGSFEETIQKFEQHTCTEEDLAKFFPIKPSQTLWDASVRQHLQCIDMSQFEIKGNFDTEKFSRPFLNLRIPEAECRNGPYDLDCVTTREFDKLLHRKLFFTLTNRKRFDQSSYADSPIVEESVYNWHVIPTMQQSLSYDIHEAVLHREDGLLMHIDQMTTRENIFFDVIQGKPAPRALPYQDPFIRLQLFYTVNADQTVIDRSVYNVFMLLGDVGGFSGLLFSIGAVVTGLINFQNSDNFLVQKLFHDGQAENLSPILDPKKQLAFKEYLQSSLPSFCMRRGCLKLSKRDRDFERARLLLSDEMDLIKLLRKIRFFSAAMKLLLTHDKTKKIQDSVTSLPIKDGGGQNGEGEQVKREKPNATNYQTKVIDISAVREKVLDKTGHNVSTDSQMVTLQQRDRDKSRQIVLGQGSKLDRKDFRLKGFSQSHSNSAMDLTNLNDSSSIEDIR